MRDALRQERSDAWVRQTYVFSNVLIAEEEARAQVFFRDVVPVRDDQLAYPGEDNVLDSLRRDPTESDHEDGRVAHPASQPVNIRYNLLRLQTRRVRRMPHAGGRTGSGLPLLGF